MRVLVTDGDTRAALAVTRALGRRGHEVWVGERRAPALAHTSRYCARRVVYPDPARDEAGFIDAVRATVESGAIAAVVPVADVATALVAERRSLFEPRCLVACADAETIARAADKAELLHRATRLGVPAPRSWFLDTPDAPLDVDLPFPIVIKPHRSRVRTTGGWVSCTVGYAASREDLIAELAKRAPAQFPIILQERIAGPGAGVFACMANGAPVALFSHRRLREKPPWGGVSVLSESAPIDPRARDYALRLLTDLGWRGVAMVEFKIDERDGEPRLMEINGRFWGSLQLAADAGVDFPNILLDSFTGHPPAGPAPYRLGVRSRWLWGDFDSLLLRLGSRGPGGGEGGRSRVGALLDFARAWGPTLYYDNPKWDDVKPWLHESRQWLRQSF